MHKPRQIMIVLLPLMLALIMCFSGCADLAQLISPTPSPSPTPTATPTPSPTPKRTPTPTQEPTPEPNVEAFIPGENEYLGYQSDFFRFGFLIPAGFIAYDRSVVNDENGIDPGITDPEEMQRELVQQLKRGDTILDFISFYRETEGYLFVFVVDFSNPSEKVNSEEDALAYFKDALLTQDDQARKENIETTKVEFGYAYHTVYSYDVVDGTSRKKGAFFVVQRGTTFAIVKMLATYSGDINFVLGTIHSLD